MLVARLFSRIFKKDGIILIDYNGQKYICGNPRKEKPITVKLLKKNLNWKLVINPDLSFPEAYMNGEILIENASLTQSSKTLGNFSAKDFAAWLPPKTKMLRKPLFKK